MSTTSVCPGSYREVPAKSACIEAALRKILSQAELLLPKMEDVQAKTMGDLVEEEMQHTAKAVEEAAAKIAVCSYCFLISFHYAFSMHRWLRLMLVGVSLMLLDVAPG